ncbi:hypothetical protein GCM10023149_42570 [Mucilaginibacter gynuensis]|uniref:VOC domain-containing protein n=1 Tax=Mucilaginibacter gynuensis TaxID=1302236 RepID=A0ABP8H668_9SPHI
MISKIKLLSLAVLLLSLGLSTKIMAQSAKPTINHIAICAQNLEKSTKFYTEVMQFEIVPNPFNDKVHQWIKIGPLVNLHIIEGDCKGNPHNRNDHLAFSVASMPDFVKHLDKLNVTYGDWGGTNKKIQKRPDGISQIYFQDPDGYWIEVNNADK